MPIEPSPPSAPPSGETRASVENIYHCCVHKTASQWVRKILGDERVRRSCGLKIYNYVKDLPGGIDQRPVNARVFEPPFPPRTIVAPIYIDFPGFQKIPKPENHRGFFVTRDPRDIVTSWYFSVKLSHKLVDGIGGTRAQLQELPEKTGFQHAIDFVEERGLFDGLGSWGVRVDDPRLRVFRYEDLTGDDQQRTWKNLLTQCEIPLPDDILQQLLDENSFRTMTEGRERGTEDVRAHLRKGVHGDWRNHFTPAIEKKFRAVTGDLIEKLGYSW